MRVYTFLIIVTCFIISCCTSDSISEKDEGFIDESNLLDQIRRKTSQHLLIGDTLEFQENLLISDMTVVLPLNDSVNLISIPIQGHPVRNDYILCVVSDQILFSSIRLNGNWINNDELGFEESFRFLSKPLIYTENITHSDVPELIIKDRQHNGNMYNVAVKHIFSLKNLNIKYLGKYEYITHLPFEDEYLVRFWDRQSSVVKVYLKKSLNAEDSIKVGSYKLEIIKDSLYYHDIKVVLQEFEDYKHLLPSSEMTEIW